jgi:hypothetical protein
MTWLALISFTCFLALCCSCDEVGRWRDGQIATSNQLAKSGAIEPPEKPVEVPDSIRDDLPLGEQWTILSYADTGGKVSVRALTEDDTARVAFAMLGRLRELGYETDDNPSRILEGVIYSRKDDKLYVRVELNSAEQSLITLRME